MGGKDICFDAIVELKRGRCASFVEFVLCCALHVGGVRQHKAVEGGDGDANSSDGPFR